MSALHIWEGNTLVLVGKNWEDMIPLLPDIPGVEAYYEESLDDVRYMELTAGKRPLQVIFGWPHAEPIDRYNNGIMFYDEVMSFTYMFADYREFGDRNPDKNFFVMDGYYGGLGLFSLFSKVETCLRYVKKKGLIPVVRLTMAEGSMYANYSGDDIWAKFYEQPEAYELEEVMQSAHVYFSPGFYNGRIQAEIMRRYAGEETRMSWPHGIYNNRVIEYIKEREQKFLPYPKKTLGVLARGTDYVKTHLSNQPIHATLPMLCEKIDEALCEWKLDYIYVSTEDASYCEYLKERYGEKICFTDQERYLVEEGDRLVDMFAKKESKKDGFLTGVEYVLSIELLARCHSLIASGSCGGVSEAMKLNDGKYENVFVFQLGVNPE